MARDRFQRQSLGALHIKIKQVEYNLRNIGTAFDMSGYRLVSF